MNNIRQIRGLKDQAKAIAKSHNAKGAFIILDYGPDISIGTAGLSFSEQLFSLNVAIHWAFEFADEEDNEKT